MADIDINTLAKLIKEGEVTPTKLPEQVYHVNADKIVQGIYEGYGKSLKDVEYDSPDFRMLNSLRENAYMFSAAKTFQETLQMTDALTDGDKVVSFQEFKQSISKISETFNENYLATEYNTAVASAQNASSWQRIQEDKSALPYLKYQNVGGACDICSTLDNITLPVDDPFWSTYYPPNHFNCRCICDSIDNEKMVSDDYDVNDAVGYVSSRMDDTFKMNVGELEEVFSEDHPYFTVPREFKEFAANNFGLPIPEPEIKKPAKITPAPSKPKVEKPAKPVKQPKPKVEPEVVTPVKPQTLEEVYPNLTIKKSGIADDLSDDKILNYLQASGIPNGIEGKVLMFDGEFENSIQISLNERSLGINMERTIYPKKNYITNDYFEIEDNSKFKGKGAEIFKAQVDNASRLGFKQIETTGIGSSEVGDYNGYYTWARLGYKPAYESNLIKGVLKEFKKETGIKADFMEMMATKEGRKLWKEQGRTTDYVFDLSKDSKNQKALQSYIDGKKGK